MRLKMNGQHLMFQAIESMRIEDQPGGKALVVRMVSGAEHIKLLDNTDGEQMIDRIVEAMAECESV